MDACSILTYHSQNIAGVDTGNNDHVALMQDLDRLDDAGVNIIPLDWVFDWLEGTRPASDIAGSVCLTFDDGCDFDVHDLDWPGVGLQRSFIGILKDFKARRDINTQVNLHATSFVIASPQARQTIDSRSLFGRGWMSDDWWPQAEQSPLLSIANHGWDHNHPDLDATNRPRGGFFSIDDAPQCELQVLDSARYIESRTGNWPTCFAYPFGESSDYLRQAWFPENRELHRCRAALGTIPEPVTADSDVWNLPRYVCGRDWRNPDQLITLLQHP
jgi:peptidoglycan/xylan/chitin deacetylase (PgdA/CDA1 family)